MKKYILMVFGCLLLGITACNSAEHKVQISPTDTEKVISPTDIEKEISPTDTQKVISPTPNGILSMTEEELEHFESLNINNRELVRQALMAEPTLGPEPYSLLDSRKTVNIGDVVKMGAYTHPYNSEIDPISVRLPIEWLVLDVVDGKALLLSLYSIDVMPFTDDWYELVSDGNATWETSELRKWLNETFYYFAFNKDEEMCVILAENKTADNYMYGVDGGGDTFDLVFLLSIDEAQKYFDSNAERRTQIKPDCEKRDFSLAMEGDYPRNTTDYYDWWLRSPGDTNGAIAYVGRTGDIVMEGVWIDNSETSVRPAMWIDLEKVKEIGLEMKTE